MKTADIRRDYQYGELKREDLAGEPFSQFEQWLAHALAEPNIPDPTAMVLATVNEEGQPHQRTVLLKDHGAEGFTFFTNRQSAKAHDMQANTHVSLLFQWLPLSRQVMVCGRVEHTTREVDERYFASRPRESQLGAWASQQSHILETREALDIAFAEQAARFGEGPIPCPPHWGGYRVLPERFEFWQGRPNRLHDRFVYTRLADSNWCIERLAP